LHPQGDKRIIDLSRAFRAQGGQLPILFRRDRCLDFGRAVGAPVSQESLIGKPK